jgi:hypothetical protein
MDLQTLTMERHEARTKFLEYRNALKAKHSEEDEALMRGYREIVRGRPVIDIRVAFDQAGVELTARRNYLPQLALARADQKRVRLERTRTRLVFSWGDKNLGWDRRLNRRHWERRVPFDLRRYTDVGADVDKIQWSTSFTATVPMVPPSLRPSNLERYHILWEAEWDEPAPRDPALLRSLGRGLYAVVATWDLTDLERAVLAGRS